MASIGHLLPSPVGFIWVEDVRRNAGAAASRGVLDQCSRRTLETLRETKRNVETEIINWARTHTIDTLRWQHPRPRDGQLLGLRAKREIVKTGNARFLRPYQEGGQPF